VRRRPSPRPLRALAAAGAAALVALGLGTLPAHAAAADPVPAGSIQVLDGDGVPVEGAVVVLSSAANPFGSQLAAATRTDGILDLTTVPGFDPAANPYTVWVDANGYAGFWDLTMDPGATAPLEISAGGPLVVSDTPATNPPPDDSSAGISGTVTDALTGDPLLGVMVSAADDGSGGDGSGAGQTTLDGTYYLNFSGSALPTTAVVQFATYERNESAPYGYATQWYDGIDQAALQPETPVPLTAGEITTGIDAALMPNGQISGTVTEYGPDGAVSPLANVEISVWNAEAHRVIAGAYTDAEGRYAVPVAPGAYIVQFDEVVDGNVVATLFFDGVTADEDATALTVEAREDVTADARFGTPPTPAPTPAPTATAAPGLAESGGGDGAWLVGLAGVAVVAAGAALLIHQRRRQHLPR